MLCNFLVQTLKCYFKEMKSFFGHEKLASKILPTYGSLDFFFSVASTAPNSLELNIRFINSCIQCSLVLYVGYQCNGFRSKDQEYP